MSDTVAAADLRIRTISGWECTPTENRPQNTTKDNEGLNKPMKMGWRRTALFIILLLLILLIFLNIALTLWIISALKLTMNGIGPIKIVNGGIVVESQSWFMDSLVTSSIATKQGQALTLHAHRNFTVVVSDHDKEHLSKIILKKDTIQCSGRKFEVRDSQDRSVFSASKDEVQVRADILTVDAVGGLVVKSAIQASGLRAPPGSDLQLESMTRRLDLRAPQSIFMESRAGGIQAISHGIIKLESVVGSIKLDAPNIEIPNLKEAIITGKPSKGVKPTKIYQLCACATGKLFLSAPESPCVTPENDTEVCR